MALGRGLRWGIVLGLALAAGAAALERPVRALVLQRAAGEAIAQGMSGAAPGMTACEFSTLEGKNAVRRLRQALAEVQQAAALEPGYAQSYLLGGRAACLLGEADQAVIAFQAYTRLRPQNPLGYLELGFAEQRFCAALKADVHVAVPASVSSVAALCTQGQLTATIQADWQAHGMDASQFLEQARAAFSQKQYAVADLAYQRAVSFQLATVADLPAADLFKWAVAATLAHHSLPPVLENRVPVIPVTAGVTLSPTQLHWFRDLSTWGISWGDPLATRSLDGVQVGVLNWRGSVVALVDVQREGGYQLTLRAKNTPPAPVILLTEVDFQSLGEVQLLRGDQSWQTFQFKTFLSQGLHVVGVNYTNDGIIQGVDRNAVIQWLKIDPADGL